MNQRGEEELTLPLAPNPRPMPPTVLLPPRAGAPVAFANVQFMEQHNEWERAHPPVRVTETLWRRVGRPRVTLEG